MQPGVVIRSLASFSKTIGTKEHTMEIIQGRSGLHVYGCIDSEQGPMLRFTTDWGYEDELVLLDEVIARNGTLPNSGETLSLKFVVEVAGSKYDVAYNKRPDREGFAISEHSETSRQLGLSWEGPRVNHLVFYRFSISPEWHALKPGEIPQVPTAYPAVA